MTTNQNENMTENQSFETRTAKRRYSVTRYGLLWRAWFQPLNPKTGQPWQATRDIGVERHDAYVLAKYPKGSNEAVSSGVTLGKMPSFEARCAEGWDGAYSGFATFERALAAMTAYMLAARK